MSEAKIVLTRVEKSLYYCINTPETYTYSKGPHSTDDSTQIKMSHMDIDDAIGSTMSDTREKNVKLHPVSPPFSFSLESHK